MARSSPDSEDRERAGARPDSPAPARRADELASEASLEQMLRVCELHIAAEDTQAALAVLERAEQRLREADGDATLAAEVRLRKSDCLMKRGELPAALSSAAQALDELPRDADVMTRSRLLSQMGSIQSDQGEYEAAQKLYRSAYELVRKSNNYVEIGLLELRLGAVHSRLGRVREAQEYFESALFAFRRIDHQEGVARALNNLGNLLKNGPRWQDGRTYYEQAIALRERAGNLGGMATNCLNLGILLTKLCEWDEAALRLERAIGIYRQTGKRLSLVRALLAMGNLRRRQGRRPQAAALYAEARELSEKIAPGRETILCWESDGDLFTDQRQFDAAERCFRHALEMAAELAPGGDLLPEIQRRLAGVLTATGRPDEAQTHATDAYRAARRVGDAVEAGSSLRALGEAYAAGGREKAAARALTRAVELLAQTPDKLETALGHRALGRLLFRSSCAGGEENAKPARIIGLLQQSAQFLLDVGRRDLAAEAMADLAEVRAWRSDIEGTLRDINRARGLAEKASCPDVIERVEGIRSLLESQSAEAVAIASPEAEIIQDWSQLFSATGESGCRLDGMLKFAVERLDSSRALLADPTPDGELRLVACIGMQKSVAAAILKAIRTHVRDKGLVLSGGVGQDSRFAEEAETVFAGVRSFAGLALSLPEGKGVLYIDRHGDHNNPYSRGDLRVLSVVSGLVALALIQMRREEALQAEQRQRDQAVRTGPLADYVTQDPQILRAFSQLERVGDSTASILITGETGTGKGLLAECIHRASSRREGRFISVNCAAIPENLLESELFGHVAGSFTGATGDKRGLFEEADGGTLFLDEIGRTSLTVQAKLLHALDTHKIRRVGANRDHAVDVRVVCASNGNLQESIRKGGFLEDLFYRLSDFTVQLPPLRERSGDIPLLIDHFYDRVCRELSRRPAGVDPRVRELLLAHVWRGNIRELIQVVRRLVALCLDGEMITVDLLPREVLGTQARPPIFEHPQVVSASTSWPSTRPGGETGCGVDEHAAAAGEAIAASGKTNGGNGSGGSGTNSRNGNRRALREEVLRLERRLISECLQSTGWNRAETARRLRISYPTLLTKIKMFGLEPTR